MAYNDMHVMGCFQHTGTKFGVMGTNPTTRTTGVAQLTDSTGGTADNTLAAITLATALTHAVGTADATVDDVGVAFNQTTLNNNFKELTTTVAADRAAISAARDGLSDLAAKLNTVMTALKNLGLITA